MFSKAKKTPGDEMQRSAEAPAPSAQAAAKKPAAKPKPPRSTGVPSIISDDVVIHGAIESEGEVQFDGEIHGDIKASGLVIGEGSKVCGEVAADKVRVCGTVEGAIRATRVELAAGALVKGDIIHTALSIEAGARFEGNVRHSDDPVNSAKTPRVEVEVEAPKEKASLPDASAAASPRQRVPEAV